MQIGDFEFSVRVHGRPVREYFHDNEIWIEGRKASDFVLRVRNNGMLRALAVPSVDGLSVMDGEPASFDSSGYIIAGNSYLDIPGWRLNDEEIAKFRFHKPERSYAAKSGQPLNIGVLGCAFFLEVPPPPRPRIKPHVRRGPRGGGVRYGSSGGGTYGSSGAGGQSRGGMRVNSTKREMMGDTTADWNVVTSSDTTDNATYSSLDSFGIEAENSVEELTSASLGTEFGKKAQHQVTRVTFHKQALPAETFEIRYGDRSELQKRGVDMNQKPVTARKPSAFPEENGCKPPVDWNG